MIERSSEKEMLERDQAIAFKESFHAGDLEPGGTERYEQVQKTIKAMLSTPHTGSTDWIWFLAEILNWLEVQADYKEHGPRAYDPWPHCFIAQDMVHAFAAIAIFFPEVQVTAHVALFLNSEQCDGFRNSLLFDPKQRSQTLPDVRTRTSYPLSDPVIWEGWDAFMDTHAEKQKHFSEVHPMAWSIAIRPILARLHRAGIIEPSYLHNSYNFVAGLAVPGEEPHRPGQKDLFINYEDHSESGRFTMDLPPLEPLLERWAKPLPVATAFVRKHSKARFALLRLWSAPQFYPFIVGEHSKQPGSFLDPAARSWMWKFMPKDMIGSEERLAITQHKFGGGVVYRCDLVLVMGEDAHDLLKYFTAVTFVLQMKPWLKDVDLWKSFINVDLAFLQGLDPYWPD